MPKPKAEIRIEDAIVSVACPVCQSRQASPSYSNSEGWDKNDVKKVGRRGQIKCLHCGERFLLPVKVFALMEL